MSTARVASVDVVLGAVHQEGRHVRSANGPSSPTKLDAKDGFLEWAATASNTPNKTNRPLNFESYKGKYEVEMDERNPPGERYSLQPRPEEAVSLNGCVAAGAELQFPYVGNQS